MGYIYKITNTLNGHNYIGQTTQNIKARFSQHCRSNDNTKLHNAIRKYGKENFKVDVLDVVEDVLLDEKEVFWISRYKENVEAYYNIAEGGYNSPFKYKTDEEKTAIARKSRKTFLESHSKDEVDAIYKSMGMPSTKNPNYGGSEKHRDGCRKYYENHKGCHSGSNNPFYGKRHTKETVEKLKTVKHYGHCQEGENNNNFGKRGVESSNHRECIVVLQDGEKLSFGCLKEMGAYFGYSNGNHPPLNRVLHSKKFPILDGAVVYYK